MYCEEGMKTSCERQHRKISFSSSFLKTKSDEKNSQYKIKFSSSVKVENKSYPNYINTLKCNRNSDHIEGKTFESRPIPVRSPARYKFPGNKINEIRKKEAMFHYLQVKKWLTLLNKCV